MRECAKTLKPELTQDELESIVNVLSKRNLKNNHLEVGTAAGGTLCEIINHYKKSKEHVPKFKVIDSMKYFPDQFKTIKENLKLNGIDDVLVDFYQKSSNKAFRDDRQEIANGGIDFLFIDGNHKLKNVMQDLRWCANVNKGGLICLHDYSIKFIGVKYAVDYFLMKNKNYTIISLNDSLVVLEKIGDSVRKEVSILNIITASILSFIFQQIDSIIKRIGLFCK